MNLNEEKFHLLVFVEKGKEITVNVGLSKIKKSNEKNY